MTGFMPSGRKKLSAGAHAAAFLTSLDGAFIEGADMESNVARLNETLDSIFPGAMAGPGEEESSVDNHHFTRLAKEAGLPDDYLSFYEAAQTLNAARRQADAFVNSDDDKPQGEFTVLLGLPAALRRLQPVIAALQTHSRGIATADDIAAATQAFNTLVERTLGQPDFESALERIARDQGLLDEPAEEKPAKRQKITPHPKKSPGSKKAAPTTEAESQADLEKELALAMDIADDDDDMDSFLRKTAAQRDDLAAEAIAEGFGDDELPADFLETLKNMTPPKEKNSGHIRGGESTPPKTPRKKKP